MKDTQDALSEASDHQDDAVSLDSQPSSSSSNRTQVHQLNYGYYPPSLFPPNPYQFYPGGETQSDLSSEVSDSNENEPDEIDAQLSAKYTDLHANASEDPQCSPIWQPLAEVLHKW